MNFQFYLEKLQNSQEYKDFVKENPKAYPCSGFFTIDKEGSDNQRHIDFYIPGGKNIFSFKLGDEIEKVVINMISEKAPEEINLNVDFNFEKVEELIQDDMVKNNIKSKLQKIMISLQNFEGKEILVCTVFISMLGILKVHIDIDKNKVTLFEKKSFFDMVRKG